MLFDADYCTKYSHWQLSTINTFDNDAIRARSEIQFTWNNLQLYSRLDSWTILDWLSCAKVNNFLLKLETNQRVVDPLDLAKKAEKTSQTIRKDLSFQTKVGEEKHLKWNS